MPDLSLVLPKPGRWPWVWFYKNEGPFTSLRWNVLPWLGSDGNVHSWTSDDKDIWRKAYCRSTLVIPFFGAGAIVIAGPWHPQIKCSPEVFE